MAFGSFDDPGRGAPMAQINMVPLIDVMLVLLVIFMVTAPLLTHSVRVELPRASSRPDAARAERVQVAIDGNGYVYWNGEVLDRSGWQSRMQAAAALTPQPEVHLRADGAVAWRQVAVVMADAARVGLTRIGFVTQPEGTR